MGTKPIKTEGDYERALARLEEIFQAPAGTPESDEMDVLTILIDRYEGIHHPIENPDPIEAIRIRMSEKELKNTDLVDAIGSASRVSEILNKRRKLTVPMVHALSRQLDLSAETLVQPYSIDRYPVSA